MEVLRMNKYQITFNGAFNLTSTNTVYIIKETPKTITVRFDNEWGREKMIRKENIVSFIEL